MLILTSKSPKLAEDLVLVLVERKNPNQVPPLQVTIARKRRREDLGSVSVVKLMLIFQMST
jgi:hypothetical protein